MFAADTVDMFQAATFGIHFLSAVFVAGLAGSAIVVVISFVEDFAELFTSDKDDAMHHTPGH